MNSDTLFEIVNAIAFFSWIVLIVFPFKVWTSKYLIGVIISLFCLIYGALILSSFEPGLMEDFSSLDGLKSLFSNKMALLAGWIHYLAFDLLAGLYIINNAKKLKIGRYWIIIPLIFTFIMGPIGFLLYLIVRSIYSKRLLSEY